MDNTKYPDCDNHTANYAVEGVNMLRSFSVLVVAFVMLCFVSPLYAEDVEDGGSEISNKQIGLGVLAGAAFPIASEQQYKITESWGFYVDIPIISTFHIAPSATLYRLDHKNSDPPGNKGITDLSLNFKFVLPFPMWKLYFAAVMGMSNGYFINGDFIQMHVGANTGFAVRIISNLDIVAMCQYKLIIDGDQRNVHMIQAMAGLQFNL